MYGIENLKKIVKFACDFTKEISNALADGKFQWTEVFGFFDEIMAIPGLVKAFPDVANEIGEITDAERAELNAYVIAEFDIPNDKVESFVENALMWTLSTVALIQQFKGLKATETEPGL